MDNLMGRYRNISILAAAIFLQVIGLAVQIKRQEDSEKDSTRLIRVWTVGAISPFEKAFVRLQTGTNNLWHNYFYLRGVRQQNRVLQKQIEDMQIKEAQLRQDAEQAHRLQTLLSFKEEFIAKTVAAQVIGTSGSEQSRLVSIDKGSDDGIKTDMAVITPAGIVGKVLHVVNGTTSQVLLINDQNSGVGTILEQSRLQGVLKGTASGELVLDQIMSEEDVKPGDRVLTSGGDEIFPKGFLVGTISRVIHGSEFLQVVVQPAASLNHLEEVLVITQKEERTPASLAANPKRAADILAERLPSVPDAPSDEAASKQPNGTEGVVKPAGSDKPQVLTPTVTATPHQAVPRTANKIQNPPMPSPATQTPAAQNPAPVASKPVTPKLTTPKPPSILPGTTKAAAGNSPSAASPKPASTNPTPTNSANTTESPDSQPPSNGAPPQ